MNELEAIEVLTQKVERLERIIDNLVPKNEQWVGPTVITKATGWNNEGMRRARRNGSVKYKRKGGGYVYLLSSIVK